MRGEGGGGKTGTEGGLRRRMDREEGEPDTEE